MTKHQIALDQQLLLSYLSHVRKQFGNLPGAEVIGLGAKEKGGEIIDEWAFRFYVHKKRPLNDIP